MKETIAHSAVDKEMPKVKKKKDKNTLVGYMFLLPAIVAFIVFKYYPIVQGIYASFFKVSVIDFPGKFIGFDNYIKAFTSADFYGSLYNNIKFLIYGMAMNFWPPILCAILINEVRRYRTFFRLAYFLPTVTPMVAGAVLWKYIWQPDYGLANYIMKMLGLPNQMWLNDGKLVYFCLHFPGVIICGGMAMLIYLAALQNIPEEHYEASLIEGAGFFYRIWRIAIPQIKTVIGMMFVLSLISTFNNYEGPLLMTDGGPVGATQTVILYAYKAAIYRQDYGYSVTVATITFLIVFILTAIEMKWEAKHDN